MSASPSLLTLCACVSLGVAQPARGETSPDGQRDSGETNAGQVSDSQAVHPSRGRIVGTVLVAGTNEPVAGAKVPVFLGKMQQGHYRSVTGTTDKNGRYSLEVPIGQVQLSTPHLPPGFWASPSLITAITSAAAPVFTKDYSTRPGPIWHVRVRVARQHLPVPHLRCAVTRLEKKLHASTYSTTDAQGMARITLPGFHGDFQLNLVDWNRLNVWQAKLVNVVIEDGFRVETASQVKPGVEHDSFEIRDKNGKLATVRGGQVTLDRGRALIDVELVPVASVGTGEIIGKVADDAGRPIRGAQVTVVYQNKSGASVMTEFAATSGADGRFAIENIACTGAEPGDQMSLVVLKDGYAGIDSPPRDPPAGLKAPLDFGTIALSMGRALHVRVLAADGQPAAGAWVEPTGSYAARNQVTMTDVHGECVLQNLSEGIVRLRGSYGDSYADSLAVVRSSDARIVMKLKPLPKGTAAPQSQAAVPIKTGVLAPALRVSGWTDGQARSLSDYRGKVVFVDFWGTWCSACVHALPALKTLHAKYKDRDVVFLSIHTAGGDLDEIREFQRSYKLDIPSGLDVGDDAADGATTNAYGVCGYPTILIIGRDGRVAWNSQQMAHAEGMKMLERAAKAVSVPWPLDAKAPMDKLVEQTCRMQAYIFGEAIDRALAKK